jgi:hypothetical protein
MRNALDALDSEAMLAQRRHNDVLAFYDACERWRGRACKSKVPTSTKSPMSSSSDLAPKNGYVLDVSRKEGESGAEEGYLLE